MRIIKPEWLRHDADKKKLSAIFSVDFHPDGTRLATSGMDNKIRLWSTHAITHSTDATPSNERLLSTLSAHSGAVLCVRFSQGDGRYLASGADDMVVLIWERDEGSDGQSTLGGGGGVETWRPMRRLTGHASDVCDVAWSPDNRYLATCGLDNQVLVWDGATFERVATLTGHEQFVKGVAFDPAGRYLATQSDDKTLRVWRTSDWAQHAVVRQPFEDNMFSTYFRRPSWAPDGGCIAAANAANGKVPVAAVISRDTWTADMSFVGHRAAIEAVRFNPRVFAHPEHVCVCAAGGQDRGVSVWLTSQHMPLTATTHLFAGNLMDLAWHTVDDGCEDEDAVVAYLAACSYDGTVAVLEFTRAELGRPVPKEEQEEMLRKHGWIKRHEDASAAGSSSDAAANRRPVLAESVEQLRLEERGKEIDRDARIAQIMESCLMPATTTSDVLPTANKPTSEVLPTTNKPASEAPPPAASKLADAPVPVMTKSGKKRVAPVFVRPLKGYSAQSPAVAAATTEQLDVAVADNIISTGSLRHPPTAVARVAVDSPIWIEARALGTRVAGSSSAQETADVAITATVKPLGRQTLIHAQSISAARVHLSVPRVVAHVTCTATTTLALLAAYNSHSPKRTADKEASVKIVSTAAEGGTATWTTHLTGCAVTLLAGSDVVAAASCTDGTLHLFDSASGARLLPPIMGEAHLAHLRCVGKFCLALDCVGQLTVWDVERQCAVVDRVSIAPLLYSAELAAPPESGDEDPDVVAKAPVRHKPSVALTAADVAPATGAPIVCLSDGRSFAYHLGMRSWLCIGDPAAYAGSEFAPRPPLSSSSSSLGSGEKQQLAFVPTVRTRLGLIQETGWHQRNLSLSRKRPPANDPVAPLVPSAEKRRLVTLDHLEHQLAAASAIDSADDVLRYADILARHLARSGDVARTEFWLRSLLGPPLVAGESPPDTQWPPLLGDVPKRRVLGRVLPILAGNRTLQGVVTEYSDALHKLC
ncbi:HIR complex subunit [Coemansia furcata]|uniref:HIR complex subunit n=1 Tax=Coemansia furcata TaxID=417177 RepID=A0ACC1LLG6_9FUNG|nr:HIR complex subunit [Coemansia furcata]